MPGSSEALSASSERTPALADPTVSVVIACYTEDRWDGLRATIDSALDQSRPPLEVIVAVDHNPALFDQVVEEVPAVRAVLNSSSRGASGTRNEGARVAEGDVLAFLDDDTIASRTWLADLVVGLTADDGGVGVGGRVDASWPRGAPLWLPPEFLWVVGASYEGMPRARGEVRNVWSENMAVWREAFQAAGGFRSGFGKVGRVSRPEDTEFCIRVTAVTGRPWLSLPGAAVTHVVPPDRATWFFFVHRCYEEGRGKAEMRALDGNERLRAERDHVLQAIPRGLWRDLRGVVRRRPGAGPRVISSLVGTAAAGYGYVRGILLARLRPA